jgi:hypothetical protein
VSSKANFKANIKSKFKQATGKCAILEQGNTLYMPAFKNFKVH